MRLEHPIFQGPLRPEIVLTKHATPENYRNYPDGAGLPDELDVWQVHEGEFPKTVDVGLVSDPHGWEDSPDAEWISSGINSKGPRSTALGRQGNLFLWGFAGDPTQMTESARRVFLNTICYMKQFDGREPLVQKEERSREWAFFYPAYLRSHGDTESVRKYVERMIPAGVIREVGLDADALEAYYRANLEYLRPEPGSGFAVDEDCVALGVSNRDVALLDRMVERLRIDSADALAVRLLDRYVNGSSAPKGRDGREVEPGLHTAAELSAWLAENRPYLFFSDVGGYRWFVDVHAKKEAERARAVPAGSGR